MLDAFAGPQASLGVTEIALKVGVPKSTAHRILRSLVESQYVRNVGNRYYLASRVFELGQHLGSCRPNGLRDRAMPFLADLYAETRETVHLAVLDGVDILYLEKLFGPASVRSGTAVGARRRAHATALGKAMLAFSAGDAVEKALTTRMDRYTQYTQVSPRGLEIMLNRTREQGFATDQEESLLGMACIAAPIRAPHSGHAVAAVSVSVRTSSGALNRYSSKVIKTANGIARHLGPAAFGT
ncbi:IclR family transcriptional regulator [Nocardia farcinica]|nr:IclR family transcriptional regulator [Nocardia farcinica]